ncbi:hypothetical protein BVX95_02085 [archaeon D22]|nr:hypothetical protein BVX95_02085 [archaeon D22]
MKKAGKVIPQEHILVPKHEKLSEEEIQELLDKYKIEVINLPRISIKDKALADFDLKEGDIIKVTRTNRTAHESIFYRRVIDE